MPHERVERLGNALDSIGNDDDSNSEGHPDEANEIQRTAISLGGQLRPDGCHLVRFELSEPVDVTKQTVHGSASVCNGPCRVGGTPEIGEPVRQGIVDFHRRHRIVDARDDSDFDRRLIGPTVHLTLDVVRRPAESSKGVLGRGVVRLQVARAGLDRLRDVSGEGA